MRLFVIVCALYVSSISFVNVAKSQNLFGPETNAKVEEAETLIDQMDRRPCDPSFSPWQVANDEAGILLNIAVAHQIGMQRLRGQDWPACASANDRVRVVDELLVLSSLGGTASGELSDLLLEKIVGPDWVDQLANSGYLSQAIRSGLFHAFCASARPKDYQFGESAMAYRETTALTARCPFVHGVGDPDYVRGVGMLSLSFESADWRAFGTLGLDPLDLLNIVDGELGLDIGPILAEVSHLSDDLNVQIGLAEPLLARAMIEAFLTHFETNAPSAQRKEVNAFVSSFSVTPLTIED